MIARLHGMHSLRTPRHLRIYVLCNNAVRTAVRFAPLQRGLQASHP